MPTHLPRTYADHLAYGPEVERFADFVEPEINRDLMPVGVLLCIVVAAGTIATIARFVAVL